MINKRKSEKSENRKVPQGPTAGILAAGNRGPIQRRGLMKRILTMLIATFLVFGLLSPFVPIKAVKAGTTNMRATMIYNRLHRVGEDEYGNPLTDGRSFPWQGANDPLSLYWGRTGYQMPNALLARSRTTGVATAITTSGAGSVTPMLWTTVYLTIIADDGSSKPITDEGGAFKAIGRWYVVMDSAGQVWFDMDGHFHDSRYIASADPFSPFYAWDTLMDPNTNTVISSTGSCIRNPRAKVDPGEANNTQGPYHFTPTQSDGSPNPYFVDPCYFWVRPELTKIVSSQSGKNICDAYANHTQMGESRVWQLGIISQPDFMAIGRTSPLGLWESDGLVRNGDWDIGLNLLPFGTRERWAESPYPVPQPVAGRPNYVPVNPNGIYDIYDDIYRDLDNTITVTVGDIRLSNVTMGTPPNTVTYLAGTTVLASDLDINRALFAFPPDHMYANRTTGVRTTLTGPARPIFYVNNALAVASIQGITIGATVRIGPDANGNYEIRTVTGVVNQPSAGSWPYSFFNTWGMNWGWFWQRAGHWFNLGWGSSGSFANNEYVYLGTGASREMLRIADIAAAQSWDPAGNWTRTVKYYMPGGVHPDPGQWFIIFPAWQTLFGHWWGDRMDKIKNLIILDAPITNDHGVGEFVEVLNYSPGDFIYQLTGSAHVNVRAGDIRLSDVDLHRQGGQIIGQGAWVDDIFAMEEVIFADPNDPRYIDSIKDNDWAQTKRPNNTEPIKLETGTQNIGDSAYGYCMPTFDISVQTDVWQGERSWVFDQAQSRWVTEWRGVSPAVTAVALRSPNPDIQKTALRVAKATLLDPDGRSFFIHTTTFHNVQPQYREYLGLEIFCDNGYDNLVTPNPANVNTIPLNLSDDYIRGTACEAYLGATNRGVDLDLNRPLSPLVGAPDLPMFYDTNLDGVFGCAEPIYFDLDGNGIVSDKDRRGSPINMRTGQVTNGGIFTYPAGSSVVRGDVDEGRILAFFALTDKYYDELHPISRLPSGVYEFGENIYSDMIELPNFPTGNGFVSAGDVRKTDVVIGSVVYRCGETVGIGDTFFTEYTPYMITLGRNGDYNYMDISVLPFPTLDAQITIDKAFKVEQTSHISVKVNPPPKPGESIFVSLRNTRLEARQPVADRLLYQVSKNQPDNWINHSCEGQATNLHCQTQNYFVNLPWAFPFYDQTYTQINVGIGGWISLGNSQYTSSLWLNYCWYWTNGYGQLAYNLNQPNTPPRIHVAKYWWLTNEVCWNTNVTWPLTGERVVVITWRGQTGMWINYWSGAPTWPRPVTMECQLVLFSSGQILMQYKRIDCPTSGTYPYWYAVSDYDIGITNGDGVNYQPYTPDAGICNFGPDGNVKFTLLRIPGKPPIPQIRPSEDSKWITTDNAIADIEFTPYRGTCLEDGTRSPVEINLYRDVGGYDNPVPRNPPPSTYMVYREPSFSTYPPNSLWNGRVIAVASVFGYVPGDTVLIGTSRNIERRVVTQVHVGNNNASTTVVYPAFASTGSLPSTCIPVANATDFTVGNPVVVGRNTALMNQPNIQETHIINGVYQQPASPTATRVTSSASPGKNITFSVNSAAGFAIGEYIGFGSSNNWWTANPPNGQDTARISNIAGNQITVEVLHVSISTNWWIRQQSCIETRDPLKFRHIQPEPVFTTRFALTLDRGLNYDHSFGDPVVGMVYFDTYWAENKWSRFDLDRYPTRQFSSILPSDDVSPDLDNGYDCFYRGRFDVAPEDIDIKPVLKKCLTTLEQRFPNVLVDLIDHDNPNDVNDPANIPISCPAGPTGVDQTIVANVNATGAGVAYLMTANGFRTDQGDTITTHRYIVQVNMDGTYEWWRWYEPNTSTQIIGALDVNDWLYRWLDDDPDQIVNPPVRTPFPQHDNQYDTKLTDQDCSFGGGVCDPCNKDSLWPCLGDITTRDTYGRFMGLIRDNYSNYPNPNSLPDTPVYGRIGGTEPWSFTGFGVPCVISRWTTGSDGGQIMFPVRPTQSGLLHIRIYTMQAIFDYNSINIHWPGPYFAQDTSYGIDYCGYFDYDVQPPDPDVNFIEMRMVDHALQTSTLNYTTGVSPTSPLTPPAPRIQADYYPIISDYKRQIRSYPGGQTHPGRLVGPTKGSGWNAYPAIWRNSFVKLGTEFYPLSDYGLYFILANATGNHLGFTKDINQEAELRIRYIKVKGPFMTPRYWNPGTLNCILGTRATPSFQYNNVRGVPIAYDYTGEIVADTSNASAYFATLGGNFSSVVNPLSVDSVGIRTNSWLVNYLDLYYSGFWYTNTTHPTQTPNPVTPQPTGVNIFDELIMISSGKISIDVELENGVHKIYEDCCESKLSGTMREIPVHGLKIDGTPLNVTVDKDNVFDVTVTEDTGKGLMENGEWLNVECNDAVVFAWQDKGVVDANSRLMKGALDGWITAPPHSSAVTSVETAFKPAEDVNGNGIISYFEDETEILASYNMATNTWAGAYIDARTYQRQNGVYKLELKGDLGCQVKLVGVDIGGFDKNNRPLNRDLTDHVIDDTEVCPVIISAYKYGDDNQDRAWTPLYDQESYKDFSHEVYLAGQTKINVEPERDYSITYGPEPLTAGVVSELVGQPLTLTLTNENNVPVDLSQGIPDSIGKNTVIDENIWRALFRDPHLDNWDYYGRDAVLPNYYWLRSDLHNTEDMVGQRISNVDLYEASWRPIVADFSQKTKGAYTFKGFIANDKGEFEVYVYTPDRKHSAVAKLKVVSPKVRYEIINQADVENTFVVPGEPDFIMTAADNRVYKITVTCYNAQDALLKGIAKTVSVCSGEGKDTARFTPTVTVPLNWYMGIQYPLYLGIDLNGDNKISDVSIYTREYNRFWTPLFSAGSPIWYNTNGLRYNNLEWNQDVWAGMTSWYPGLQNYAFAKRFNMSLFASPPRGVGLSCIYNDLYAGTYLFADLSPDARLTFRDSLSLDENARTTFFIFATDATNLTGLVGDNEYSNSLQIANVAINPFKWRGRPFDGNYVKTRFSSMKDGRTSSADPFGFYLDWEAIADRPANIEPPKVQVFDPVTGEEWGKALGNPEAYDLVYSTENHMLVRLYPADDRDKPLKEGNAVSYAFATKDGNKLYGQHEQAVLGRLTANQDDPNIRETNIFVTPTGTGNDYAGIFMQAMYANSMNAMDPPWWQAVSAIAVFDVVKGIAIEPQIADTLKVGRSSKLTVKVVVAGGAGEPVPGAKVTVSGVVDSQSGTTNQKGEVELQVKPKEAGRIVIKATHEKYGVASGVVGVEVEVAQPMLIVEPIPSITKNKEVEVKGKTNPGSVVKIGGQTAKVDANGNFTFSYKLNNEGFNQFDVEATNAADLSTIQSFSVVRDTVAPEIILDQTDPNGRVFASPNLIITGRVEPFSKVKVNGVDANVVYDIWSIQLNATTGPLTLNIDATDVAGNDNKKTFTVEVWKKDVLTVSDGDANMLLNGSPTTPLARSPYIEGNNFLVPVEVFTTMFNEPSPVWDTAQKTTTFKLSGKDIVLNDGKADFTIAGETFKLAIAPKNVNGVTYVEATAFAKLFDVAADWNVATKVLTLARIYK